VLAELLDAQLGGFAGQVGGLHLVGVAGRGLVERVTIKDEEGAGAASSASRPGPSRRGLARGASSSAAASAAMSRLDLGAAKFQLEPARHEGRTNCSVPAPRRATSRTIEAER